MNFDHIIKRLNNPQKSKLKGEWQEYAINICKEFNINAPYKSIIFKFAKKNLMYLKGKVDNLKEMKKFKELQNKGKAGHYLISMFRKKNKDLTNIKIRL